MQYHKPGTACPRYPLRTTKNATSKRDKAIASSAAQASSMQRRGREHVSLAPTSTTKKRKEKQKALSSLPPFPEPRTWRTPPGPRCQPSPDLKKPKSKKQKQNSSSSSALRSRPPALLQAIRCETPFSAGTVPFHSRVDPAQPVLVVAQPANAAIARRSTMCILATCLQRGNAAICVMGSRMPAPWVGAWVGGWVGTNM